MSQEPDNLDPKEATEAKLCAYLEGEITPTERAEIEKYLQSNPQHRKLLNDLAATRNLLRLIPSEPAPPEIAEAFEGQLERSLLLDGSSKIGPRGSVTRWPQLLFAAAMVLLVTGLGVLIYFTLPVNTPPKYSVVVPPKKTATKPSVAAKADVAAKPITVAATPPINVAVDPKVAAAMNERAKVEDGIKSPAGAMDASAATPMPAASNATAVLPVKPVDVPPIAAPPPVLEANKTTASLGALNDRGLDLANNSKLPTRYIILSTDNPALSARDVELSLNSNHVLFATGSPVTQSALESAGKGAAAQNGGILGVRQFMASTPTTQQLQATGAGGTQDQSLVHLVYIARSLSGKQANAITNELAVQKQGQSTQTYTLPAETAVTKDLEKRSDFSITTMPTSAPSDIVAKDDQLVVTVAELVGPGVDKTNTVKVATDGTITLPMIEPIHADGLAMPELEKQIAAKYREANLIPSATVQITHAVAKAVVKDAPSTQAVSGLTTQPTTVPVAAGPTSQPAEESNLQVVIIVQQNAPPATTEPTTQISPNP